ncbi:hypothetical protein COOONC_13071, partial [Cooperia oncophora]
MENRREGDVDENSPPQVSDQRFEVKRITDELDKVGDEVKQLPLRVEEELSEARIAGKYRNQLMEILYSHTSRACTMLEDIRASVVGHEMFGKDLLQTLQDKGIESMEDLNEYISVTERDDRCRAHSTLRDPGFEEEHYEAARSSMKMKKRWTPSTMKSHPGRSRTSPIGAAYAPASRQHSEISGRQNGTSGQDALNFMAYIQANACISPGIFKGNKGDNFEEFIRRSYTTSELEENRERMTGLIKSARSLGIRANGDMSGPLIDMVPVYDASGNRMEFMGAVKITVELEGGRKAKVSFHIMDVNEKEILLGTNSLDQLGVNVHISPELDPDKDRVSSRKVIVARRAYITPHSAAIVSARCEGHGYEGDRLIWPHMTGMVAGVYTIKGRSVDVSVVNDSDEPMICREGDVIGQWGTEKWREGWEDVNPLMLDSTSPDMSPEQRRILLLEQIKEASSVETLSEDV